MLFRRFQHYKGGIYQLLAHTVTHTETGENLIVYRSETDNELYARPSEMFFDYVEVDGDRVRRFTEIDAMKPVLGQLCTVFPEKGISDFCYVERIFEEGICVKSDSETYYIRFTKETRNKIELHSKDGRPVMARKNIFGKYKLD